ncbi:hypothetical protein BASA84_000087 [Batrachochytrium salamandrivorans]|nr:hypothetical protein BASA84_000087 [Batrachochytrium salamandrivorans]
MVRRSFSSKKVPRTKASFQIQSLEQDATNAGPAWLGVFSDGAIKLSTLVKPNAKLSRIIDVQGDALSIQLAAPPHDGDANNELVRFLATTLKLRNYQISIMVGHKSRRKVLRIESTLTSKQIQNQIMEPFQ